MVFREKTVTKISEKVTALRSTQNIRLKFSLKWLLSLKPYKKSLKTLNSNSIGLRLCSSFYLSWLVLVYSETFGLPLWRKPLKTLRAIE